MSTEIKSNLTKAANRARWAGGIALISIGLLILVAQFAEIPAMGMLFLPGLGLIFLIWGLVSREGGLLIPGGILSGIGTGVYLMGNLPNLSGEQDAGVFLLAFAGGWALITLLSLFTGEMMWWPLIPGLIIGLVGVGLFIGGPALTVLSFVGRIWPVFLIIAGVWVMIKRR